MQIIQPHYHAIARTAQDYERMKGVFRCQDNWWSINRAKDTTSYAPSAYRRDSRLEIILDQPTSGWLEFEHKLLGCFLQTTTVG